MIDMNAYTLEQAERYIRMLHEIGVPETDCRMDLMGEGYRVYIKDDHRDIVDEALNEIINAINGQQILIPSPIWQDKNQKMREHSCE